MYPSVFSGTIHKGPDGLLCHKMHIKEAELGRALPALIESGILQKKQKHVLTFHMAFRIRDSRSFCLNIS